MEAKRAGMRPLVVDKGCLCNSLYRYPTNMVFFTTAERLEIGDLPLTSATEKPTRGEALKYYRKATAHYELELRLYEHVERAEGSDGRFVVHTVTANSIANQYAAKKIALATGYYDLPNRLIVPGEELPHVSHYYTEAHPFWGRDVVVVGGKNSAAEAALDLFRAGARVTLVHRRAELGATLKYWVRPDIENRIKAKEIRALLETRVTRIEPEQLWVQGRDGARPIPATQVTRVSSSARISFALMRFSMSGRTQYFKVAPNSARRWTRVTRAPARKRSSAASAAEFFPPTTTTSRPQKGCASV